MLARAIYQAALFSLMTVGAFSAAHGLTPEELAVKLERAGYSQVREIKSGKITTFKAVKDGKQYPSWSIAAGTSKSCHRLLLTLESSSATNSCTRRLRKRAQR